MSRRVWQVAAALVGGWCLATAHGGALERAFERAQAFDPTYRAAREELAAAQQSVPMARAALRPNVSVAVSNAQVNGARTADNFLGQPVTTPLDYRSPQQVLSLRWPLLNREASEQVAVAEARAQYASAVFTLRGHDLLDRLAQAWLQRQFADTGVATARTQLLSAQELQRLARRRLQLGEGTRPEAVQADADVALAQVQLADADNQLRIATLALVNLTGTQDNSPFTPSDGVLASNATAPPPLPALDPATLDRWTDLAMAHNPALAARRQALTATGVAVARAQAGHWPRLDLVASAANGRNDSVSTLNQAIRQRSIGLQLNLPLYAGGYVEASVAQALAEQGKAQAELEAEELSVRAEVQRLFLLADSGTARLAALQQGVAAADMALEGARKAFAGGVGVQADVARAQARVAESRRELDKARFEHLLTRVRLQARAGAAPGDIARALDGVLR
jgi:protease secretion system outer membrane protein